MTPVEPPRDSRQLQYIDLVDFTPGIFTDYVTGPLAAPDGAAQLDGTWGCVAGQSGGLAPGPRMLKRMKTVVGASHLNPASPYYGAAHVLAMRAATGVLAVGQKYTAFSPDALFFTIEYSDYSSGYRTTIFTRQHKTFFSTPGLATQYPFDEPSPSSTFVYQMNVLQSAGGAAGAHLGSASLDLTRANKATPTSPGTVFMALAAGNVGANLQGDVYYPDPDSTSTDSQENMGFGTTVRALLAHQDRLVGIRQGTFQAFGTNGLTVSGDTLEFTNVNNPTTLSGTAQLVAENPSGYGAWASMNASELFLVKNVGGGLAIRGDLANPQVTRLPGIAPVHMAHNVPTVCPLGCVYGTREGVWLWTGGDTAQHLSPQLNGWFWRPYAERADIPMSWREGSYGNFKYQYPYVFAPNNFIMDTRSGGWFRLPLDVIHGHWDVSANGLVIGGADRINVEDQQMTLATYWDVLQGTNKYRWKSQPLQRTRGRRTEVRELLLSARGLGKIIVTVTAIGDPSPRQVEFEIDSQTQPQYIRRECATTGFDVVVSIHSEATNPDNPAPVLHRLSIGHREGVSI